MPIGLMYLLLSLWELQSTQVWWKFYKVVLFDSFFSSEYAPLAGVHYSPHNRLERIDVTLDEPPLGVPQQQLQLLLQGGSSSSSTTTTSVPYYATATTTATTTSSYNKNNRNSEYIHGCPEGSGERPVISYNGILCVLAHRRKACMHCATSFMSSINKKHMNRNKEQAKNNTWPTTTTTKRLSSSVQPNPSVTDRIDIVSNNEPELEDCGRVEVRTKHQRSTCIPPSPKRRHCVKGHVEDLESAKQITNDADMVFSPVLALSNTSKRYGSNVVDNLLAVTLVDCPWIHFSTTSTHTGTPPKHPLTKTLPPGMQTKPAILFSCCESKRVHTWRWTVGAWKGRVGDRIQACRYVYQFETVVYKHTPLVFE